MRYVIRRWLCRLVLTGLVAIVCHFLGYSLGYSIKDKPMFWSTAPPERSPSYREAPSNLWFERGEQVRGGWRDDPYDRWSLEERKERAELYADVFGIGGAIICLCLLFLRSQGPAGRYADGWL